MGGCLRRMESGRESSLDETVGYVDDLVGGFGRPLPMDQLVQGSPDGLLRSFSAVGRRPGGDWASSAAMPPLEDTGDLIDGAPALEADTQASRANEPVRRPDSRLARTIVSKVIAKLHSAHRDDPHGPGTEVAEGFRIRYEAERFLGLVLSGRVDRQWDALAALRDRGVGTEILFLDILSPAIRHLGTLWEDDRMSFIDVTTKSAHLQQMMRRLGAEDDLRDASVNRRILLTPVPGEQHTFGVLLLAEMFLKIGWDAMVEPALSLDEICAIVARERFDAVGLSVGSERSLADLPARVSCIRGASSSPDLKVFLGGWAFLSQDASLCAFGADLVATDARTAIASAQRLCPTGETIHG